MEVDDFTGGFVRQMIGSDLPGLLTVEQASFKRPKSEVELAWLKNQAHHITRVVEALPSYTLAGYLICEIAFDADSRRELCLHINRLAVHPDWRRRGLGQQLVASVLERASKTVLKTITAYAHECDLAFQLFLRQIGFRYVKTLPDYFPKSGRQSARDAYLMEKQVTPDQGETHAVPR